MAFWTFLTFFQQVNRSTLGVSNYPHRADATLNYLAGSWLHHARSHPTDHHARPGLSAKGDIELAPPAHLQVVRMGRKRWPVSLLFPIFHCFARISYLCLCLMVLWHLT